MNIKRGLVLLAALGSAIMALAEVQVMDVKIASRYPWDGKVDISYNILTDDPQTTVYVNPVGYAEKEMRSVFPSYGALSGDGATGPVKAGKHHLVWDVGKDMPDFTTDKFSIKIFAGRHLAPYMVVELTTSSSSSVWFSSTPPDINSELVRSSQLWLKLVLPGTFMMGSPSNELMRASDEVYHKVTLTQPYYMGVLEVTQGQWYKVIGNASSFFNNNQHSSYAPKWPYRPVDMATWVEATNFVAKIRSKTANCGIPMLMRTDGYSFSLPTEAQWEYACRAGTVTAFNNGLNLKDDSGVSDALANVGRYLYDFPSGNTSYGSSSNTSAGTAEVGSYKPNALGLYDMHGNVCEWCADFYGDYPTGGVVDPKGPTQGTHRVLRGGAYSSDAGRCRSACRRSFGVTSYSRECGFRLCCSVEP